MKEKINKKIRKIKKLNLNYNVIFIYLITLFLFLVFLLFLVNLTSNNNFVDENIIISEGDPIFQINKFDLISNRLLFFLNNKSFDEYSNNQYFNYLILNNKINNKYNSFGQEIIEKYLNNQTNFSKRIAKELIYSVYGEFDSKEEQKWRNSKLELYDGNWTKLVVLYQNQLLLINFSSAKIRASKNISINLYDKEIYSIIFKNNSIQNITIDLNNNSSKNESYLKSLINNSNILDLKLKFSKSNEKYFFKFYIWK